MEGPDITEDLPIIPYDRSKPLQGTWILDQHRSQSIAPHLAALGLSELAQLAAEKVDITMLIVHSSTGFTLTHRSALGEKTRALRPTREVKELARDGSEVRVTLMQLADNKIQLTTFFKPGKVVDTREAIEDDSVLHQTVELFVGKAGTIRRIVTQRYYRRIV